MKSPWIAACIALLAVSLGNATPRESQNLTIAGRWTGVWIDQSSPDGVRTPIRVEFRSDATYTCFTHDLLRNLPRSASTGTWIQAVDVVTIFGSERQAEGQRQYRYSWSSSERGATHPPLLVLHDHDAGVRIELEPAPPPAAP